MNLKLKEKNKSQQNEDPSLLNYFYLAKQNIILKNKNIEKDSDLTPGNAPSEGSGFAFKRLRIQKSPEQTIEQMIKMKRKKLMKT